MLRTMVAILALVVGLAVAVVMQRATPDEGEEQAGPGSGEGWTGLSEPDEIPMCGW